MVNWIIIVIILSVGFLVLKIGNLRHRFWIAFLLLLALFLYVSMVYVNRQNNLDFTSADGVFKSLKIYAGWLGNGFQNMKRIGGYAVKMDWTSTNGSILDNKQDTKTNVNKNQAGVVFAK